MSSTSVRQGVLGGKPTPTSVMQPDGCGIMTRQQRSNLGTRETKVGFDSNGRMVSQTTSRDVPPRARPPGMLVCMTTTEARWTERVLDWRASGKTAEAFADGQQFEAST